MRLSAILVVLMMLIFSPPARAASDEAKPYKELTGSPVLAEKDDGRIEVISFFWYGCGTCFRIDEAVSRWADKLPSDVRFIRKHVAFGPPVDVHARIFTTLKVMGRGHEDDLKVFNVFLAQRKPVNTLIDLPRLAEALSLDEKKLIETFNSKEVDQEMAKLDKLMAAYNIEAVPSLVIDGKYVFNVGDTNGPQGYLEQADRLIQQRRQERLAAAGNK